MALHTPRVSPSFTYQMPPPQPRTARPPLPAPASAAVPRWMLVVVPEDPAAGAAARHEPELAEVR